MTDITYDAEADAVYITIGDGNCRPDGRDRAVHL